mgnify:CR=1 FL=1
MYSVDRFANVPSSVQKRAAGDIKEWIGNLLDADLNQDDLDHLDPGIIHQSRIESWIFTEY